MEPNNLFLSTQCDPLRSGLLHGTCADVLPQIAADGLLPRRNRSGLTNWEKNPSHADAVYLTTAYALHYAHNARVSEFAAILDIDVKQLVPSKLVADEDSYATSKVEGFEHLSKLGLSRRVEFWRDRLHTTDAAQSLNILGNCAYLGAIPAEAVIGVRLLNRQESARLILGVCDPVIAPSNFRIMGGYFQRFNAWLVGREGAEDGELVEWFSRVCLPALPVMSLIDAAHHIKKSSAS